eukprot:PhF_6_TR36733/c0_g1_i1/m.54086
MENNNKRLRFTKSVSSNGSVLTTKMLESFFPNILSLEKPTKPTNPEDTPWVRIHNFQSVSFQQLQTHFQNSLKLRTMREAPGVVFIATSSAEDAKRISSQSRKTWPHLLCDIVTAEEMKSEMDLRAATKCGVTMAFPPLCFVSVDAATVTRRNEEIFDLLDEM